MEKIRLSPAERFVLWTAQGTQQRIAIVHAVRKELSEPGSVRHAPFGFADMMRYVFLLGFNRQPFLFTVGPIIAGLSYIYLMAKLIAWFIGVL